MHAFGAHLLIVFNIVLAFYFVIGNGGYSLLMILSLPSVWLHRRRRHEGLQQLRESAATPPATIIIPAFNEQEIIVDSVRSMLATDYPGIQVCVIDDGSSDETLGRLVAAFSLTPANLIVRPTLSTQPVREIYLSKDFPNLLVISKENGGKPDALNAGLNMCRTPYFCTLDADCIPERDGILRLMRPIVTSPIPIVASGGMVCVLNGCKLANGKVAEVCLPHGSLERFQVIEYLRSFLFGRTSWNLLGGTLLISGAFGVFHRETVIEAGGFSKDTVTEDMELIVRLRRWAATNGRVVHTTFASDPVCWVQCPRTLQMLARQRRRWQLGLCQTLWKNRALFFNPAFPVLGWFSLPFHALVEGLGAIVEPAGYLMIPLAAWLNPRLLRFLLPLFVFSLAYSGLLSLGAVVVEEMTYRRYDSWRQLLTMMLYALIEGFGYRQLVLWYRLMGVFLFFSGSRAWETVSHFSASDVVADGSPSP